MTSSEHRRYVIVGAGAIGGTVGGLLARSGADVVLVARGAHAQALADRGLTLRTPDGTFEIGVTAAADPAEVRLTSRDVLVFATKTQHLEDALHAWVDRPVHHGDTVVGTAGSTLPVLTALNGVVAEEMALRFFARVFGVCVWMPAAHVVPGEVIVRSWPVAGQFHISRWPADLADAEDDRLLSDIAATWTPAGLLVVRPPDVAPWKYRKLLANLANAVVALTGSGRGDPVVIAAVQREGEAVLRHAGIEFVPAEVEREARRHGPRDRDVADAGDVVANSTWQSLARNSGSVETDYLNGEIVRIAHRHGMTAPVNAGLARLARAAARDGHPPGRYSGGELAEALGLVGEALGADVMVEGR